MRHRRASRDVASRARPRASSSESSESPHAYFANASSIADDMSRSRRARRGARAREWNGGFVTRAQPAPAWTYCTRKYGVFDVFCFFLFCVVRASTRSFVRHRHSSTRARFDSNPFDSTRLDMRAVIFARSSRARARTCVSSRRRCATSSVASSVASTSTGRARERRGGRARRRAMEEDGFPSDADVRARANANASERRDEMTVDD